MLNNALEMVVYLASEILDCYACVFISRHSNLHSTIFLPIALPPAWTWD